MLPPPTPQQYQQARLKQRSNGGAIATKPIPLGSFIECISETKQSMSTLKLLQSPRIQKD